MFRTSRRGDVAAKSNLRKLGRCPWPESFFLDMPPLKYVLSQLEKDPTVDKDTLAAMRTALSAMDQSTLPFKKLFLSHLLQVHAGSLRQFAGRWVWTGGACPDAPEGNGLPAGGTSYPHTVAVWDKQVDLDALERRTWAFTPNKVPWTLKTWEPYSDSRMKTRP